MDILQFQVSHTDVIESFVVQNKRLIRTFNKLIHGEKGVVRFHNTGRHLRRRDHRVGTDGAIGKVFADFVQQQRAHTTAGTTANGVDNLKTLKTRASFSLLADHIHRLFHEFGAFGVVSLGPVVSSSVLAIHKVVRREQLALIRATNGIEHSRFEIDHHRAGQVSPASTFLEKDRRMIKVMILALARVDTQLIHVVLTADRAPEFLANLITTLSNLNVDDFSHVKYNDKNHCVECCVVFCQ
mmetsp:Transcript_39410/g.99321  ORF Transcript_39410/g.99321 Transcript_39410/m.99321 type:complete len:241 (+) Transcript_39410:388-1110(+)